MRNTTRMRRLIAVLAAVALFAVACGDDDATDASNAAVGGDSTETPADDGADDSADDSGTGDDSAADDSAADDGAEDGDLVPDVVGDGGSVDCAELQRAMNAAGDLGASAVTGDAGDPAQLEASFNESRAQLAALGQNVPELADEVTTVLAGLDVYADAFGSIGWDVSGVQSNPAEALEFAQLLGSTEILSMAGALQSISEYVVTSCS